MSVVFVAVASGLGSGALVKILDIAFGRKRDRAETTSLVASAADVLADGASKLVPYYEKRLDELARRVSASEDKATKADEKAVRAEAAAMLARLSEEACRARLNQLEAKFEELLVRLAHPASSTTVTTAVTTHPQAGE